jgi:hypothetical protein
MKTSLGIQLSSFVTKLRIYVRQPGEVRPHKPGLLAYTHEYQVIKKRFAPRFVFVMVLFWFNLRASFFYLKHPFSSHPCWYITTRRFTYSDLRLVAKTAFSDLRLVAKNF